ncbi:hypothetical protein HHI36_018719 [Cryptolaemus montrouzieri]|uniref:Uncharacterized protein n=1 Tax=Cryptolaemus montrouzieri TaxID=559131 RepID=A0ABD2P1K1_9CUCU
MYNIILLDKDVINFVERETHPFMAVNDFGRLCGQQESQNAQCTELEIQDARLEYIPSVGVEFSVKSDKEYSDGPQTVMALGDSPPQQP